MNRSWLWLIPTMLAVAPASAQQARAPVVAVFLMENRSAALPVEEKLEEGLTDYMSARLGEASRFQIIPRDEIKNRLTAAKAESYKECYDTACQIEVGKELAAEFSVSSSVARVGSQCLITASVWDLRRSTQIRAATAKGRCDPDELIEAIERVTDKLAAAMAKALAEAPSPAPAEVKPPEPEPVKPPEPVAEPEPVKPPEPEPEPVAKAEPAPREEPAAAGEEESPPFVYLSLGVLGLENVYVGDEPLSDTTDFSVGFGFDFDFRLGGSFMLGGYVDFMDFVEKDYDIARYGVGLRIGGLIRVGSKVVLVPFGRVGLLGLSYTGDCYEGCPEDELGVRIGAGFGVKVMFLRWLGIGANLHLGFYMLPEADWEPDGDAPLFIDVGADLGLVVAF